MIEEKTIGTTASQTFAEYNHSWLLKVMQNKIKAFFFFLLMRMVRSSVRLPILRGAAHVVSYEA